MIDKMKPARLLTPLGIGVAFSLFGDSTLYTVLPKDDIASQAGISLAMVGLLLGLNRVARMVSNGPLGMLFDRLPRRPIMVVSLFLGAFSTLLYGIGYGPGILIFARILWGACWSGIWIGANTMALDISCDEDRGHINGRLQMWFFMGVALTNFTGGLFTDLFGYRGGLYLSAGLTLLAALMWLTFLPETRNIRQDECFADNGNSKTVHSFPWKKIFQASYPLFTVRLVFAGVLASTTILWLQQFFDHGITVANTLIPLATATGIFSALRIFVSILSAPVSGKLSDLMGKRWLVIATLFIIGTIGMLLMASISIWTAVTGALLSAITGGGIQALAPSLVGDSTTGKQHGRALSIVFTVGDLGSAIGPPLALFLIPLYSIRFMYIICAILFLITFLTSLFMVRYENNNSHQ